ncbi:MAG: CHAT domain-containing protein, partial [Acidobacteria bacterium]|nr:CHAT domain-containing protein [Acidobacteriota bacterium]
MREIRFEVVEPSENHVHLRLYGEDGRLEGERELDPQEVDSLITRVEKAYRRTPFPEDLPALGAELFRFLDGDEHGWLRKAREASRRTLTVRIDVRGRLAHLPWELLHDGGVDLCSLPRGGILPVRQVGREVQKRTAENRPLRILFMAADPLDGGPSLRYEQEESLILKATRRAQLELEVEESGSLRGLEEKVQDFGDRHFDVFHLTGHAALTKAGPIFLLENDEGLRHEVSPEEFQSAFGEEWPSLLFLSGCETGKAQDAGGLPSFCEALVRAGAPAVLGWALPVRDNIASLAAEELYQELATGRPLDEAVVAVRAALHAFEKTQKRLGPHANWHLLRLYSDGSDLGPRVTPPKTPDREVLRPALPAAQDFLDAQAKSEVCPRERFVGRRRQV